MPPEPLSWRAMRDRPWGGRPVPVGHTDRRAFHLKDMQALCVRALASGGKQVNPGRVRWDISCGCQKPYVRDLTGIGGPHFAQKVKSYSQALTLEVWTPCRKCEHCRKARRVLWRERARTEVNDAIMRGCRTWFVTLTPRPEVAAAIRLRVAARELRQGVKFEQLPEEERFALMWDEYGKDVTKWIKRLRIKGAEFRYLAVVERFTGGGVYTRDGVPHCHLLIHETNPQKPVRWAILHDEWELGFSTMKLVEEARHVSYVTKYLAKELRCRVRNSQAYGKGRTFLQPSPGKARL